MVSHHGRSQCFPGREESERRAGRAREGSRRGASSALRGEISALVKAGKKSDAITHYQAASGEDLTTAKGVVEALEAGGR